MHSKSSIRRALPQHSRQQHLCFPSVLRMLLRLGVATAGMSADTDIEFDDDFLREVEALEAAVLRSRGETALSDRPGASCHTSAGTNASRPTKSNQQPDLALIVPASGQAATIVPHAEEPKASSSRESYCISRTSMFESGCREEEPVVSMNSKKKAGKEHCDLSQEDGQKSNNLQSLRCKGDGDVGTMTYRWTVDTICVQDSMHCRTKRMQEVVGKGDFMVNVREGEDGALVMLRAVITSGEGGRAMDIPREAISFLTHGEKQHSTTRALIAPSTTNKRASPTILLGLGIGCTIVMHGVLPVEGTDISEGHLSGQDPKASCERHIFTGCLPVDPPVCRMPSFSATPERRQLAHVEVVTPSPTEGNNRHNALDKRETRGVWSGKDECPDSALYASSSPGVLRLDSILERLIDTNSRPHLDTDAENLRVLDTKDAENRQPSFVVAPDSSDQHQGHSGGSTSEQEGLDDSGEVNGAEHAHVHGDGAQGRSQATKKTDSVDGSGNQSSRYGASPNSSNRSAGAKMGIKDEKDVPDQEWRRPLIISPSYRRQAAAGRRRPTPRDIPHDGPVVLSLAGFDDDDHRDASGEVDDNVMARMPSGGASGRKRHRAAVDRYRASYAGGRSREKLPRPGTLDSKMEASWLALRRILHERYRELEENDAAEEAAAEASHSGAGGDLLSPGLR